MKIPITFIKREIAGREIIIILANENDSLGSIAERGGKFYTEFRFNGQDYEWEFETLKESKDEVRAMIGQVVEKVNAEGKT